MTKYVLRKRGRKEVVPLFFTNMKREKIASIFSRREEISMKQAEIDRLKELESRKKNELTEALKEEMEELKEKRVDAIKDVIRKGKSTKREIMEDYGITVVGLKNIWNEAMLDDKQFYEIPGWEESVSKVKPPSKFPTWGGKRLTVGVKQLPKELIEAWDDQQTFSVHTGSEFKNVAKDALVLIPK